ncbi:uncharacterized protein LOC117526560 [Thalassophryne amazonica]|uniref:uncharacterized protein LOC117526560 n=1 Tax=Thalassophryne amazonica TaxID=390379 RepID=UPI001470E0BF|nr:uncharacterized protein LOC117526560 [Thalassophryne amazonica]
MSTLFWSTWFFCLSVNAETFVSQPGESVTFDCSFIRCHGTISEPFGMYLVHTLSQKEHVLYYVTKMDTNENIITQKKRYINRTKTVGSLTKNTITISNLTALDAGFYSCEYHKRLSNDLIECNNHILFITETVSCIRSVTAGPGSSDLDSLHCPVQEQCPLVLIIITACTITVMVTIILILLIILMEKLRQRAFTRRRVSQTSGEFVYEVMNKNGFHPRPAMDQTPCSPRCSL